jgi:hypothetical protein
MGHNVDLGMFGMCAIRCQNCGNDLDISEVDIDCDVKSRNPMQFELSLYCSECEEKSDFTFRIIQVGVIR